MAGILGGGSKAPVLVPQAPPPVPTQAEAALAAEKDRQQQLADADEERKRAKKSASGVLLDKPGAVSASSLLNG